MNFDFFASLFNKQTNKSKLLLPDSILIKNLKSISHKNNFYFYQNITIYHHNKNIFIPLFVLDPNIGIFLFEYKEWTYNDLNNYTLQRSTNVQSSKDTLAYEKINKFITTKFNEILHNDGIDIFNFLLSENLSSDDYKHLDSSKQMLLPYDRVIFSDSSEIEILEKLSNVSKENSYIRQSHFILANLFTQYLVLGNDNTINLATDEQIKFIEHTNYDVEVVYGHTNSGKTTAIMLKSILLKLKDPKSEITIIRPTKLSCDKLKAKLLNTIEYAIIDIDITTIKIITPIEFKSINKVSQYVFCDDTNLLEDDFLEYLYDKTSKSQLSLVNPKDIHDDFFKLTKKFNDKKIEVEFLKSNPITGVIQIVSDYSSSPNELSILCISSDSNKLKLDEDLKTAITDKVILLDSSKSLIDQEEANITLSDYENINANKADIVLLLDINETSEDKLAYAISLANKKIHVIYIDECEKITNLKKIYNIKLAKH